MLKIIAFTIVAVIATAAMAQEPLDPRLTGPMLQALQAEVTLRDAAIKAMREDKEKRDQDLAAWFKGWFGEKVTNDNKP